MPDRHGIRLIEVIVVVVIVLGVVAFFGPAVNSAREAGRRVQCANNMRNIGLALLNYATSKNRFPNAGTFFDDPASHGGDPAQSTIYRALTIPDTFAAAPGPLLHSWVYSVMPYFDASNVAFPGSPESSYLDPIRHCDPSVSNRELASVSIGFFECPDDRTLVPQRGQPELRRQRRVRPLARGSGRMVGEAGRRPVPQRTGSSGGPPGRTWKENQAVGQKLGVMFLGTQTGDQPWDIETTPADITDGCIEHIAGRREHRWPVTQREHAVFGRPGDELGLSAAELHDVPGLGRRLPHAPVGRRLPRGAAPSRPQGGHRARAGPGPTQAGTFENINFGPVSRSRARSRSPTAATPADATSCSATVRSASFARRSTAPSTPS